MEIKDFEFSKRFVFGKKTFYLEIREKFQIGELEVEPAKYHRVEILLNDMEVWRHDPKYGGAVVLVTEDWGDEGFFVRAVWKGIGGGFGKLYIDGEDLVREVAWGPFLAKSETLQAEGYVPGPEAPPNMTHHFYYYHYLEDLFPHLPDVLRLGDLEIEYYATYLQRCKWMKANQPDLWAEVVEAKGDPFKATGTVVERLNIFRSVGMYIGDHYDLQSMKPNPQQLGVLAYGSLIDDPGAELEPLISGKIETYTPFKVEYARSSMGRAGAPTLVPVQEGGSHVQATILAIWSGVNLRDLKDIVWRRETGNVGRTGRKYDPHLTVVQIRDTDHEGLRVLYCDIEANIRYRDRTPDNLADLAWDSNRDTRTHAQQRDGISYLANNINNEIITPLTLPYAHEILERAGIDIPPGDDLPALYSALQEARG